MVHPLLNEILAHESNRWIVLDAIEHESARDFVKLKAAEGSAYHIEALAYAAFTEPPQFASSSYERHMTLVNLSKAPYTPYPKIATS